MMRIIQITWFLLFVQCMGKMGDDDVSNEIHDSLRVEANQLYTKGDKFYYENRFDSAIHFYKKGIEICKQIDYTELLSSLTNDTGLCFKKTGRYDSALIYYERASQIDSIREDTTSLVGRWRNIANVYKNQGEYGLATKYINNALSMLSHIDDKSGTAKLFISLGSVFVQQNRNVEAIGFYRKALSIFQQLKDKKHEAYTFNNIGISFKNLSEYDSALLYYQQAKVIKEKIDSASLASTLRNIGNIHQELGDSDSSFHYFIKAHELYLSAGNMKSAASTSTALGEYYIESNELDIAKRYLDFAYHYASEQNNRPILLEYYSQMAEYSRISGQLDGAYEYLKKWANMQDSVFNQEKLKTIELQHEFEIEQRQKAKQIVDQQIQLANLESNRNMVFIIVLLVFLLSISTFSYLLYKQRMKLSRLNLELNKKNEKVNLLNKQNFHFTKNSLASMVGLLNVKTKYLEEGGIKETLLAEKLKMETVNVLYNELFSNEFGSVDLEDYLEKIVSNTLSSLTGNRPGLRPQFDMEKVMVSNEVGLNLGIMINEMCINTCKYALTKEESVISISMHKKETSFVITFSDQGQGFPADFDWAKSDSFGTKLIKLLANDLEATLDVDSSEKGLTYIISVPFNTLNHEQ